MSNLKKPAITILIGTGCGGALEVFGFPAGSIAGAMAGVAFAAAAGLDVGIGKTTQRIVFTILGVVLGTEVTPETIETLRLWPLSAVALLVCLSVLLVVAPYYLRRIHGFDRDSAKIAAVPGAMSYSLAVAVEYGLDVRRIAVMHTIRLTTLIVILPIIADSVFDIGDVPEAAVRPDLDLESLALLGGIGVMMFTISRWVKIPVFEFFGTMVVVGVLFATGIFEGKAPAWLVIPTFILTGCIVGSFFAGTERSVIYSAALAGLGNLCVGAVICTLFAVPTALLLDLPVIQVWLGFAPGGFETMIVLAFVLGYDPAYVAGHQLVRFVSLSIAIPFLLRRKQRPP